MSDNISHFKLVSSSEKSFGLVFGLLFLLICLYPLIHGQNIRLWALAFSIIIFLIAFLFPKVLYFPNKIWLKFGLLLSRIVAPIVMALLFFLTIVPIGLIIKLIRIDIINKKFNKNTKSYWINRTSDVSSMKDQF